MKKAIIIQNCDDYNIIKEHSKYAENIYVDVGTEDKLLKKYNLDYYIFLQEKEEIVFCKNLDNNSRTFISDGNWMIPENRIYPEISRNGSPCVIKANKYLEIPFLKSKILKNFSVGISINIFVFFTLNKFMTSGKRYPC